MTAHKDLAQKRAKQLDPKNYTCGGCRRVQVYKGNLECPNCGYGKASVDLDI